MKRKRIYSAILTAAALSGVLLLGSCAKNSDGDTAVNGEIRLAEAVSGHATRVTDYISDQLPSDGKVCVSIWDGGNPAGDGTPGAAIGTDFFYTATGSGNLTLRLGSQPYFPVTGNGVLVKAYYPYESTLWTNTEFTVRTDQSTPAGYNNSDLLYAKGSYARSGSALALDFKHQLSRISFTLTAGTGLTDISNAEVTVMNVETKASFDFPDGTLSGLTGSIANITPYVTSASGAANPSGMTIVVPQKVTAGAQLLRIELADGKTFYYKPAAELTLESGYDYRFDITVNLTGLTATYSVSEWGTGTVDDGAPNANEGYLMVNKEWFTFDGAPHTTQGDDTKLSIKTLLSSGATVEVEAGAQSWLGVALSDGSAGSSQTVAGNAATDLYLSLSNNYTGAPRTGMVTVASGSVVKEIVVEQGFSIYKVGDYWPDPNAVYDNGMLVSGVEAQGIVYWLDPAVDSYTAALGGNPATGPHGRIVGLLESRMSWADESYEMTQIFVDNMRLMAQYIGDNGLLWSNFPAFESVHSLNDASEDYSNPNATGVWYLPAKFELQHLLCAVADKDYETWYQGRPSFSSTIEFRLNKEAFNNKLTAAGGAELGNGYYWSSSENYINLTWYVDFTDGNTYYRYKSFIFRVRTMLAF